jgi:hypothetical protein
VRRETKTGRQAAKPNVSCLVASGVVQKGCTTANRFSEEGAKDEANRDPSCLDGRRGRHGRRMVWLLPKGERREDGELQGIQELG